MPRIVLSAPQGRSGKTTVAIALSMGLRKTGLVVQPFKKGPDYIDPSWLSAATGRSCRNLDSVLVPETTIPNLFADGCAGAGIALIEGAMGLYDGFETGDVGSTAQLARLLGSPVILVINCSRMTQSVAAMVSGYQRFEPETDIAGVILNYVSGNRHEQKMRQAIKEHCGVPVVGCLPKSGQLNLKERHLGLVPFPENESNTDILREYGKLADCFDLDTIQRIAAQAKPVNYHASDSRAKETNQVKIGIIYDRVFNFYYPENLAALRQSGAQLVFIDSMKENRLPEIDGLYIGGGFPEMFLPELAANEGLKWHIATAIEDDLPVYAECAGLMYLCRHIRKDDRSFSMVGTVPADIQMSLRPQGHGYIKVETVASPFFPGGLTFWGHEFHYSKMVGNSGFQTGYKVIRGQGIDGQVDGFVYRNVFAAYTHLHATGVPVWAPALVNLALKVKASRKTMVKA